MKIKRNGGFTLVEVLITIFILAVVVLTLITVFVYGFNLLSRMKQVSLATQIAKEQAEIYRNMTFEDILALPASGIFTHQDLDHVSLKNSAASYTIEDVPSDSEDKIKKLTLTITWDYRGTQLRKDIVTYINRFGINKQTEL
jgi:prepilin-type N-terminal cleavage/methylation domain-containing protein